ncbi:MAG: hypothetical protein AMS27_10535 [Bacteroides sp. SM23_62_1]|nr:MAG: hypothetical protein AMS27_10535 [Bacteroides sp. SM23_62_1]
MRYSPTDIKSNPEFELLDVLHYDGVLNFARKYIRKNTRSMIFFYIFLICTLVLLVGAMIYGMVNHNRAFLGILKQYFYGLLISFSIIIPVHEIVHGMVYVLLGAKKILFGAEIKQFAFYAVADEFVTGRAGFYMLAISPFIVISLLNLAGFIFVRGVASYTYLSMLFFHTTMCIGDFALMSYYDINKEKEIYTFDDVKSRISYFYCRKK